MSENCQDLRDFLSGNLEVQFFSEIEGLREHWYECEECRAHLTDAISLIDSREKAYLSRIVDNLQLLHRQFEYAEWRVLHPPVAESLKPLNFRPEDLQPEVVEFDVEKSESAPPARQPHTELLKLLAQAGDTTREQLQFLNENWGLCHFCVALRVDSCQYYSKICGPLISSLPPEVQLFIFRAILAAEILDFFREQFPAEVGPTIYRTVEHAAPEFLRKYLQDQKPLLHIANSPPSAHEVPNGPIKMLSEKIEWIEDGVERLKNLGMEQIDLLKSGKQGVSVDDDELCELFGGDLYRKLSPETRSHIRKAELYFRNPMENDFSPAIQQCHSAYEFEFRARISSLLASRLPLDHDGNYGSSGRQLIKKGKFNGKIGLGDQLGYLKDDRWVREILATDGFSADQIYTRASELNRIRNSTKRGNGQLHDAERVRNMLRGSQSILILLFPAGKA
jgi:hypothetical protein